MIFRVRTTKCVNQGSGQKHTHCQGILRRGSDTAERSGGDGKAEESRRRKAVGSFLNGEINLTQKGKNNRKDCEKSSMQI